MEWSVDWNKEEKPADASAWTVCPVTEKVFEFHFEPLHFLLDPDTRSIASPKVDVDGVKWWLEVYPCGVAGADGFVSCYLRHDSYNDQTVYAKVSVKMSYDPSEYGPPKYFGQNLYVTVIGENQRQGWDKFLARDTFLLKHCDEDDFVSFHVQMSVYDQEQSYVRMRSSGKTDDVEPKVKRRRVDNSPLLLDPTYSDMTLVVQGERIPAHKCLLCPRSSVFRAMFQHPMQEAASNEVQVGKNYEPATIKAMLHYLYAGMIPEQDLSQQAARLMDLAVYYQMDDLKEYAESHLLDNLTAENVGEVLQLGQLHGCKELVVKAQKFIVANAKGLIARSDFLASLDLESSHKMLKTLAGVADVADVDVVVEAHNS